MSDPRHGVPSASAMRRLVNCPPAHRLSIGFSDESSEAAASGTRIHAVLAGEADESTLDADELGTLDMCKRQEERLSLEFNESDTATILRERRLGLTKRGLVAEVTQDSKAAFVFTGQFDFVQLENNRALVIDYKTGRGNYAEAVDNEQLAALAALVAMKFGVAFVRVALVQPWVGQPTVADYDADALAKAKHWLLAALEAESKATPEHAKAGDWCNYCKFGQSGGCHTFNNAQLAKLQVLEADNLATLPDNKQREAMFARAMELPADKLAEAQRGLAMVKRYVAAIEGASRKRAELDADFQRFYTLREKRGKRTIADVQKVFHACAEHGVTADAFTAVCSVSLKDVKEILRAATGAKGKTLDNLHEQVLDGAIETGKPVYELTETTNQIEA